MRKPVWASLAHHMAVACRLSVKLDGIDALASNIAADETSMAIPSCDLMKADFPSGAPSMETTRFLQIRR